MRDIVSILLGLLVVLLTLGVIFLFLAGATYLICLGFGLMWNWFIPLAVLVLIALIRFAVYYIGA